MATTIFIERTPSGREEPNLSANVVIARIETIARGSHGATPARRVPVGSGWIVLIFICDLIHERHVGL
jgi:hypothetical protein